MATGASLNVIIDNLIDTETALKGGVPSLETKL
jgi:hypothetical protein